MSHKKLNVVTCDTEGCNFFDCGEEDVNKLRRNLQKKGWERRRINHQWFDFCPVCSLQKDKDKK